MRRFWVGRTTAANKRGQTGGRRRTTVRNRTRGMVNTEVTGGQEAPGGAGRGLKGGAMREEGGRHQRSDRPTAANKTTVCQGGRD